MVKVVGIRGAVQARANRDHDIFKATRRLIVTMMKENRLTVKEVISVILTMTPDLRAAFPAYAVRIWKEWRTVPLLCAAEVAVPGAMPRVIRLLMHARWNRPAHKVKHVYLGNTASLRPDLAKQEHPL